MFTGIIEAKGKVLEISGHDSVRLVIRCFFASEVVIGASVSVNGVCLTVVLIDDDRLSFDVIRESLNKSSLSSLNRGDDVNLERALLATGRFDGHIVQGHVDCTGRIVKFYKESSSTIFQISIDPQFHRFIIEKGSVCIDGISLTVINVLDGHFTVGIIPHTLGLTCLANRKVGDRVNIECDILVKSLASLMKENTGTMTREALLANGF
jgi:riboflavin synthase